MKRRRGERLLPPRLRLCQYNEGSGGQDTVAGAEVTKLPPVADTPNDKFPEARKYIAQGFHRILYRFSPDDYKQIGEIWNGISAIDGSDREVRDGLPEGGELPDLNPAPPLYAPNVNEEDIDEIAQRLGS